MATVLEIIQGIQQAAANAYDGALDEKGEPLKVGLQREEGHPILDKRVMDGFGVCIYGNILTIKYQGEVTLKEVYKGDFEGEIAQRLQDIVSFLKKEYKKVTGGGLTLTKEDKEPDILVQSTSRIRSWVQAKQNFKIGGIPDEPELGNTVEERLDDSIKKFLGIGKDKFPKSKEPENVSGKRDLEPPEKKKLAEGIDKKKLARAWKIIKEEITFDGKAISPKKEEWLRKTLSKNAKVAKAFGLSGEKAVGSAGGEESKAEQALKKAVKDPEQFAKLASDLKVDDALVADAEKAKKEAEEADDAQFEAILQKIAMFKGRRAQAVKKAQQVQAQGPNSKQYQHKMKAWTDKIKKAYDQITKLEAELKKLGG